MRLLIAHGGRRYRFLRIDSSKRDGSIKVGVDREGAPGSEITIHQSGRINFHETRTTVYVEPMFALERATPIYRYRIPKISRLKPFSSQAALADFEFDLNDLIDCPCTFTILIAGRSFVPRGRAVHLCYLNRYSLIVEIDEHSFVPPEGFAEHFFTLKPEMGTRLEQAVGESEALIAYHQVRQKAQELIVYGPNGAGVWQAVFPVPMRAPPKLVVTFDAPLLFVDESDVETDSRVGDATIRFKVRRRGSREIIKTPVAFTSIELDSRL